MRCSLIIGFIFVSLVSFKLFSQPITVAGAESKPSQSPMPFAWSAEKDGKIHYILGTSHEGVSLEELLCSDNIVEQLKNSDLVFVESLITLIPLNQEEMRVLFTGSKKKREEIFNRTSLEDQQRIKGIQEIFKLLTMINYMNVTQRGNENFEDLSKKTREFLINHGADIQGNYVDYFYFLHTLIQFEVYFSFGDRMDFQVAKAAKGNNIRVEELDDYSKIVDDLMNEIKKNEENSEKRIFITRADIESLVDNYTQRVEMAKRGVLGLKELYISGSDKLFISEKTSKKMGFELALLRNRNKSWVKKFIEAHENPEYKSIFLAAGIGHFTMSFSLIDLLTEEGFSITRTTCTTDDIIQN